MSNLFFPPFILRYATWHTSDRSYLEAIGPDFNRDMCNYSLWNRINKIEYKKDYLKIKSFLKNSDVYGFCHYFKSLTIK